MDHCPLIWLNGTSSSGKTTIAKMLQTLLPQPYLHAQLDLFVAMLPEAIRSDADSLMQYRPQVLSGFHHSIHALRGAGNKIIVDHVLRGREWLKEVVGLFGGQSVLFVGVHCPIEVVEERERQRRDRQVGLARQIYYEVHADCIYDLEMDTSKLSAEECAAQILGCAETLQEPTAFVQMHEKLN